MSCRRVFKDFPDAMGNEVVFMAHHNPVAMKKLWGLHPMQPVLKLFVPLPVHFVQKHRRRRPHIQ